MFTRKRKLTCVLLVVCCIALVLLASCNRKPEDDPTNTTVTDYGINGVYYTVDDGNEYLFTITGNTFLISGLNGEQTGTFTYESGALTLTFKQGDGTNASAKLADGVLELTYNGGVYRLLARTQYTVSFDTNGGSAVAAQKVYNGSYAEKPADPAKEGYAFIGWYTDSAYTTPFVFDSAMVTGDITVYARFEAYTNGRVEYTATFAGADAAYNAVKTINGILYNLPTPPAKDGKAFLGWWVSDAQIGGKLTYKYEGQVLTQDVILFAVYEEDGVPAVSVNASGVSWNALGAGVTYRVLIQRGDTVLVDNNVGDTKFSFDFTKQEAGEYTITITAGKNSSTVYYLNKTLDRASGFRVVSGGILLFNPVANAQKYTITVRCGTPGHSHENINNGLSTNYIFANCGMPEDGITFIVTASADGYLSSVATYNYYRGLSAVSGVTVDNNKISWLPVEDAIAYIVGISKDGKDYSNTYVSGGTELDISGLGKGKIYVTVTPVADGYYVAPATPVEYTKVTLAVPSGISLSGKTLTWNAVAGATGYNVTINGKTYTTGKASIAVPDEVIASTDKSFDVAVQATGAAKEEASAYCATVKVSRTEIGEVSYRNGVVSWTPVYGAVKYIIRVGSTTYEVSGAETNVEIVFTESGETEISVSYLNDEGSESGAVKITVDVFCIELDVRGGTSVAGSLYKAFGDEIKLPGTTRDGYDFAGWYTTPGGAANGKEYTGSVFQGESDIILYATWSSKKYHVSLVVGEDGTLSTGDTMDVVYGKINKAPVPTCTSSTKAFAGWFTEPGGAGIRYFDENGETDERWNTAKDVTLYAYFSDIFTFTLINSGAEYSVSKGAFGIGALTEITIPKEYNGKPVSTVEAGGFYQCYTLRTVNIPNTVTNIAIPTTGINSATSPFQYCSDLATINIYDAGAKEPKYFSEDGALYSNEMDGVTLIAVPYAKAGILRVYEGTAYIKSGAFTSSKVSEIIIPYTVKKIGSKGISSCYSLQKITFESAPEGTQDVGISLVVEENGSAPINSCSKLAEIILPAHLAAFSHEAINGCSKLTTIDFSGTCANYTAKGEAGKKVLCDATGETLLFCPRGMEGAFKIPAGVKVIGENAFASCSKLTDVTIPGYVTTIEKTAFKSCSGMTALTLENEGQALTIKESAFYSCSGLTTLTLPERLVKMEKNAFGGTSKLTMVTVNAAGVADASGALMLDLADAAFATTTGTYYVTTVNIGEKVPAFNVAGVFGKKLATINVSAQNKNYASVDGVLYNKDITNIIYFPLDRTGVFVMPDTITEIGASVFEGRTGLTGVVIGYKVASIGDNAFKGCNKMVSVTFTPAPENVKEIPLTIGVSAFESCSVMSDIVLPGRLTEIGANAFDSCRGLIHFVIPEGVTKIGAGAFDTCSKMISISLPASLAEIELDSGDLFTLFNACPQLQVITVGENSNYYAAIDNILYAKSKVTDTNGKETYEIRTLMFCPQRKAGSTDVTVSAGVNKVLTNAFAYNKTVTSITFHDAEEFDFGTGVFQVTEALTSVKLPVGMKQITEDMFYWCKALVSVEIPYTVESIGIRAFGYSEELTTITFAPTPEKVERADLVIADATANNKGAFYYTVKLASIEFPERMTVLGNYAFGGARGLSNTLAYIRSVSFPSTLQRIGDKAFYNATALTSVTFAPGTKLTDAGSAAAIGSDAFSYCSALKTIALPENTTAGYSIGTYAFSYSGINEITIPVGVKKINNYAFNRSTLSKVIFAPGFDGSKLTLGTGYVFQYSRLSSITLPEGITEIPASTFAGCVNLTEFTIPSSVTKIGASAFSSCANLETVTFATYQDGAAAYSKVNNIGASAFEKTALTAFNFPTLKSGSITLGTTLFKGCAALNSVYLSKSVNNLGTALTSCYSIRSFTVDAANTNFSIDATGNPTILYNANMTAYRYICGLLTGELIIPVGITEIGANMFEGQSGITSVVIPYTVKTIGNNAFKGCQQLLSVTFEEPEGHPSQLKTPGTYLFGNCYKLKSVTLPSSLTSISQNMFQNCYALTSITIPGDVTTIGNNAFANAGLTSVVIPCKVKTIGNNAFSGQNASNPGSITSVTFEKNTAGTSAVESLGNYCFQYQIFDSVVIPKSMKKFTQHAFANNPNLKSFTFEENAQFTDFGTYCFNGCTALETITVPAGVTKLGNYTFKACTAFRELNFAGVGVTTFGTNVFDGCTALKAITLPASLTSLGNYCFQDCTALESIAIPDNVTSLGNNCFNRCTALKAVTFTDKSALNTIMPYCFRESAIESIVIPKGVTVLGTSKTSAAVNSSAYQFKDCVNLKSVVIKGDLTLIGGYVFDGCTALTDIKLPETVTQIGNYSFRNCTALESIVIPKSVTVIGTYSFQYDAKLTKVEINSAGALAINTQAFDGTGITAVTIPQGTTEIGSRAFQNCANLATVVFEDSKTALKLGTYAFISSGVTSVVIPARVNNIGNYCFDGCTALKEVTFEEGSDPVTLGTYIFQNCTALTTATLSENITSVSNYMFKGCSSLSTMNLAKVSSIGSSAFNGCSALRSITLPSELLEIGGSAFLNSGLTAITIPKSCETIGSNVFAGSHRLTTYVVEEGNTSYEVFSLTENEKALVTKGDVKVIIAMPGSVSGVITLPNGYMFGAYSFNGIGGVTGVVLPDDITEVPNYAFAYASFETLVLPASVTKLGAGAFYHAKIGNITLNEGLTEIGNSAFESATLTSIAIPDSVVSLGESAFELCENLKTVTFTPNSKLELVGRYLFQNSGIEEFTFPKGITQLASTEYLASYTFDGCKNLRSVTFLGDLYALNSYAFRYCTSLKSIVIPDTVQIIGSNVFEESGLESIDIPASLRSLYVTSSGIDMGSAYTFRNCFALKEVTLHEGLEYINYGAFQGCSALESIVIPASVETIDTHAFGYYSSGDKKSACTALATVEFAPGSKLKNVGNNVFQNSGITSIVLPVGVTKIGTNVFDGCSKLTSATFLGAITELPNYTFQNCTSLSTFVFPDTVNTVGLSVFAGAGLETISIPATVLSWSSSPFKDCVKLRNVVFENGCTIVTGSMFSGCTELRSVKLASTINNIGSSAFADCTKLTSIEIPAMVSTIGSTAFSGWTSAQTINMRGSQLSAVGADLAWLKDCDAKVVWDYTPEG